MMIADILKENKSSTNAQVKPEKSWILIHLAYALLLIYILVAGVFDGGQFIYFAF